MTNYKPHNDSVQIGGWTNAVPPNAKVIGIYQNVTNTTSISLHIPIDDSDYTVASGKKLIIVGCYCYGGSNARTTTVFQADDADGVINASNKMVFQSTASTPAWFPIGTLPSVAASKYVNVKVGNNTGAYLHLMLYGYEIDT